MSSTTPRDTTGPLRITTPDAAKIVKLALIRAGPVTHGWDYMIFILDGNGVPSVGRIIFVK